MKGPDHHLFPDAAEQKKVVVTKAQASWIVGEDGLRYNIPTDATVYTDTENTTYEKLWVDLAPGTQVTLFLTSGGKVDSMYANLALAEEAIVVTKSVSDHAFDSITGGASNMTYYRNNYRSSLNEIRQYDVVTYDAGSNTLHAANQHVTGIYENASPNPRLPRASPFWGSSSRCWLPRRILSRLLRSARRSPSCSRRTDKWPVPFPQSPTRQRDRPGERDLLHQRKVTLLNGKELETVPNLEQGGSGSLRAERGAGLDHQRDDGDGESDQDHRPQPEGSL